MKNKSEASREVLASFNCFEGQSGQAVRSLYIDGGKEFLKGRDELKNRGVEFDKSTSYTPYSNGIAERHLGTILTAARAELE